MLAAVKVTRRFGGVGSGYIVRGNTFDRRANLSDTGRLWLEASAGLMKHFLIERNTFRSVRVDSTWQDGLTIRGNRFDFTNRDAWAVGVTFSFNAIIEDNVFELSDTATSAVLSCGACRGAFGRLAGNVVRTNATVDMFTSNSLGYQQHFDVPRPNILLRSNGASQQMVFSDHFQNGDIGNLGRQIAAAGGAIPPGYYVKSSIVWNTGVAPGGTAAQICTTSGYYAPAWASSTTYRPHTLVTNDSGKVYVCIATGTSAASGGPTGIGATIVDGSATWSYVAASAAAAFKVAMTAAA